MSLPCVKGGGTVGDGRIVTTPQSLCDSFLVCGLGHLRGKTIINRFLTLSGRYATLHSGATLSPLTRSSPGVGALGERERATHKPLTLGEVAPKVTERAIPHWRSLLPLPLTLVERGFHPVGISSTHVDFIRLVGFHWRSLSPPSQILHSAFCILHWRSPSPPSQILHSAFCILHWRGTRPAPPFLSPQRRAVRDISLTRWVNIAISRCEIIFAIRRPTRRMTQDTAERYARTLGVLSHDP